MHTFFILIHLLHFYICFEYYYAHLQEDNCISTASGIVTLFRWMFSTQVTRGLNEFVHQVGKKHYHEGFAVHSNPTFGVIARSEPDGTRWRTGGEVKGKDANGVGSQQLRTGRRSAVYTIAVRWSALLECQQSTELTPPPIQMDSSVSLKDQIWFLRVCHHVSNVLYCLIIQNIW